MTPDSPCSFSVKVRIFKRTCKDAAQDFSRAWCDGVLIRSLKSQMA